MGILVGIYVADVAGAAMRSVAEAELIAGRGIAGDRYFSGLGKFSPTVQDPDHEVTLMEIEQLTSFNASHGTTLGPDDLRRNLFMEGVDLNALVDREFAIGDVVLRGRRLCEPCEYLAGLTHRDVLRGLVRRAGLRAGIVRGGLIRVGDSVGAG